MGRNRRLLDEMQEESTNLERFDDGPEDDEEEELNFDRHFPGDDEIYEEWAEEDLRKSGPGDEDEDDDLDDDFDDDDYESEYDLD